MQEPPCQGANPAPPEASYPSLILISPASTRLAAVRSAPAHFLLMRGLLLRFRAW
jgi:hypothetical protein